MWIAHALLKWFVFTIPGFAGRLESQGIPAFMAWPVFPLELTGGVMILTGFYGRYVSATLVPIVLVAAWTHASNCWLHTNEGGDWEYLMFLVLASIVFALIGDGRFAPTKSLFRIEEVTSASPDVASQEGHWLLL